MQNCGFLNWKIIEKYIMQNTKGKVAELEVDFVALNNNGRIYIQVCETLKDNENKIFERELHSLRKISNNYEKTILTYYKTPISNEDGIIIRNVLE